MPRLNKRISEPSILVKPVSRFGGLDNIHIALSVLVVILVLLLIAVSFNTKIYLANVTTSVQVNTTNHSYASPRHTVSEIRLAAERLLAGYSSLNSSLSLLPYFSNVSAANVSYLQSTRQWLVTIPYSSPINGRRYLFGVTVSDLNLSSFTPFIQVESPIAISDNYVISRGVVKLSGQTSCQSGGAMQVYWFIDPYAPGSISSLHYATDLESEYGSKVNVTFKVLYAQASQNLANSYGLNNTMQLGKYLFCASVQRNFTDFVNAVNTTYQGTYVPAYQLQTLAGESGLNVTQLNSCVSSSQGAINAQALQAKHYNITSSAAVLVNCAYLAIPQTARSAVCYENSTIC